MDYRKYRITAHEKAAILGISAMAAAAVSWLFYNSWIGMILTPVLFVLLGRIWTQNRIHRQEDRLSTQFLDLLRSVTAALKAGYSVENSWKEAQKEIGLLYGNGSEMYRETAAMNRAAALSVPLEESFREFALRSGVEEIMEFSEVFRFAKRSGGRFVEIMENTAMRLSEKYETEKEIEVLVAAKKMEQKVMNVIPFFILLYLRLTDPEYMSVLYGNLAGVLFMTACLAAYAGAVYLSRKVLDIRV